VSQASPKKIFGDILNGRSFVESSFGKIYIKHLNNLDISEIDNSHAVFFEQAKKKNVPTFQEKLDYLISNSLWNKKDEDKIKDFKSLVGRYQENKSNEFLKSKRDTWDVQLKQLNKDIAELEFKRNQLIGETAETFAYRKSNILHIKESFYKTPDFNHKLLSNEEYDELDQEDVDKLFEIFTDYLNDFKQENLKKISLSGFFMNMFNLTESVYEFYGRPIIQLSLYQIDLVSWGKYFKHVLSEMREKIPAHIMADPDKIIEYVELNRNYEKANKNSGERESGAIPGAKKEDLEILGMKPEAGDKFSKKLKEKGSLSSEDIFNII
jgi:hypothetical protein